ncbi:MaoC family dehydratase [Salinactinospora qingdaonensis]|uniref:3-hydroxyacyl-thioester dehydratase HtdZ n=1 Tax=Salinactinospora qingdaonensis TaxID=702744 RepID=A0ABP7FGT5_9ACTN
MRTFTDINALTAAQGEHLGYSQWHTVTQEQINLFADATGDHQWIHVDPERAAQGPFQATIAHGFLSLSMLPMLAAEIYTLEKPPSMGINYGLNRVRFLQPVVVGKRVRSGAELSDARENDRGVLLTVKHQVDIEGESKPALVAETLSLLVP